MKETLTEKLGTTRGEAIYTQQTQRLALLISRISGKTPQQTKTLTNTILPRVALYQVLREQDIPQEEALEIIDCYMTKVATGISRSMKSMERMPGFYHIFRRIFTGNLKKSDNWETEMGPADGSRFTINIVKCLWYDACVEHDCPELCRCFCRSDDIIYGTLKKVRFTRAGSLADGASCCDFNFDNVKRLQRKG